MCLTSDNPATCAPDFRFFVTTTPSQNWASSGIIGLAPPHPGEDTSTHLITFLWEAGVLPAPIISFNYHLEQHQSSVQFGYVDPSMYTGEMTRHIASSKFLDRVALTLTDTVIGDEHFPAVQDAIFSTLEPLIYLPYTEYQAFRTQL